MNSNIDSNIKIPTIRVSDILNEFPNKVSFLFTFPINIQSEGYS